MAFLEDLQKVAKDAADSISNVGQSASAAIDQATRNAAALAGSGVTASGRITGPAADKFGSDPHSFVLNVARQMKSSCRELCNRIAERNGRLTYEFSTPDGKRKVTSKPSASASTNQIALTLVLAVASNPSAAAEEAGRMASDLPVKKSRGLAGEDETYTIYAYSWPNMREKKDRGLFGIDDAVILTIIVPIIAQIAAVVLPTLIAAASNVISQVTNPGPTAEEKAAAAAQAKAEENQKTMVTVGVVGFIVVVGGIGVWLAVRRKKAA